ncbi:MAG TPA: MMPL family transporter [Acidimicrobiales bacterium]|nr:MMPL family transporter [Acidimicrobiales bacterium]
MFAAIGRFAVRRRWWVVIGWLLVTAASVLFLPALGGVVKNDSSAFLPRGAPSVVAAKAAEPFLTGNAESATIVAVRPFGRLTPGDQAAFAADEARVRARPDVVSVHDLAVSADGQARTAEVQLSPATAGGGPTASAAVDAIRGILARAPDGLELHLTGPLPELVDQQHAGSRTASHVQLVSALIILVLLALSFRATLAPLVTVAPAILALALASPIIAESTHLGVKISSLLQLLLTALVLGAGTDYGIFLIFRYRENLRLGLEPDDAIVASVDKVGASVTFSGATVIAALLSLVLASFGLYRGVGPGLALGILIVLAVELTFFPALLAVLGRAVFWPTVPRPGPARPGRWGAVAARVSGRPVAALAAGTLVLGGLSFVLVAYAPSGFDPGGYIAGSDSGVGQNALVDHFGASAVAATAVVYRVPTPVWRSPDVLDAIADDLFRTRDFTSLSGPQAPNGYYIPPDALAYAYRHLGPPGRLPAVEPPGTRLSRLFYDTYRAAAGYVSDDGRTFLFKVSLRAGSPGSTAALQAVPRLRRDVSAAGRPARASWSGIAGQVAVAADVSAISGADIVKVAPVVMAVLAILLAIVLRSLIAPIYLVLSVALSYLASLGLAVLIFVVFGHQLGINFTLPFFMFVFIMALGEDYNILVMTRIREEAATKPIRPAVATALGTTGTTVTSAGLVLAASFGVLAVATSGQVSQIGTGLALGILIDTFIVRTLLVPSAAVLVGRWNWWPSRLFATEPDDATPTLAGDDPYDQRLALGTARPVQH